MHLKSVDYLVGTIVTIEEIHWGLSSLSEFANKCELFANSSRTGVCESSANNTCSRNPLLSLNMESVMTRDVSEKRHAHTTYGRVSHGGQLFHLLPDSHLLVRIREIHVILESF